MTSDDRRLRAAFADLSSGAAPTPLCPEPQALWTAVGGEASPSEARRLVLHVAECPACAEAWRLARELRAGPAADAAGGLSLARPPRPRVGAVALAIAAGVAVALAVGVVARVPAPPPPSLREGVTAALRSLVPESRPLPRTQCVLRWTGAPAGARYTLRVVTETLDPIAHVQGLESPRYQVPEAKLGNLSSGARLMWQVEAFGPDGARQTSPTFVSRLE